MLTVIQMLLLAAFAAALGLTVRRGKQNVLSRSETFLWGALWIAGAVVTLRPEVTTFFAGVIGVGRGTDAVMYVSVAVLFYLTFRIFLRIDKLDHEITELVRREALRDAEEKR